MIHVSTYDDQNGLAIFGHFICCVAQSCYLRNNCINIFCTITVVFSEINDIILKYSTLSANNFFICFRINKIIYISVKI